jgi:branched-chain amino acid transport system substrate-binding protein
VLDTIAAVSFASWQTLTEGVEGAGSLDQAAVADRLQNNTVETILGPMTFDPENQNYGPDLQKVSQIRDGQWVVVYPPEFATEDYEVLY